MESKTNTNRKGFLKRTGLAIASVFSLTASSAATPRASAGKRGGAAGMNETAAGDHGAASSAFARVRTAQGAVPRQTGRV